MENKKKEFKILEDLNSDIGKRSTYLFWTGIFVLATCLSLSLYIYYNITGLLDEQICLIDNSQSERKATLMTIYLVFRILTIGTIPTALLIFGYNIVRASFDQSVRFAKRKHSALFWQFLHIEYEDRITDISFDKFKDAFESWNKTTESSFTNIKVSNKNHFGNSMENITNSLKDLTNKVTKLAEKENQ